MLQHATVTDPAAFQGDVYPHSMNAQGGYFGEDMPDDFTELPPARPAFVLFDEWRKQWLDLTWISVPRHHFQVLVEDFDSKGTVEVSRDFLLLRAFANQSIQASQNAVQRLWLAKRISPARVHRKIGRHEVVK